MPSKQGWRGVASKDLGNRCAIDVRSNSVILHSGREEAMQRAHDSQQEMLKAGTDGMAGMAGIAGRAGRAGPS